MSSAFIGLPVLITLRASPPGDSISGTVASIDAALGLITLSSVTVRQGGRDERWEQKVLRREDVAGLKLVSLEVVSPRPEVVEQVRVEVVGNGKGKGRKGKNGRALVNGGGEQVQAVGGQMTPRLDYNEDPATRRVEPQPQPFDEEFDFGAGLATFDKRAVFQEIREQDDSDPALRLHAHNRNGALAKMAPSENVLSRQELQEQQAELARLVPPPTTRRATSQVRGVARPTGFVTVQGIKVVQVRMKQYREVLSIADIESGPTLVQRTENAARGIASFILQTLTASHRLPPSPTICILCGDCDKGSVALRAGVHLRNHGRNVVAYLPTGEQADHSENFRTQIRVFSSAGGRIVRDMEDLAPAYDLIIDAMSDNEIKSTLEVRPSSDITAATWANGSAGLVISLDAPFGTDHDTGTSTTSSSIQPDYVLCQGAARAGLGAGKEEVVVLDVGISPALWARVGVDWDAGVFGGEYVVSLQRG